MIYEPSLNIPTEYTHLNYPKPNFNSNGNGKQKIEKKKRERARPCKPLERTSPGIGPEAPYQHNCTSNPSSTYHISLIKGGAHRRRTRFSSSFASLTMR
jgi:hypothetical protein